MKKSCRIKREIEFQEIIKKRDSKANRNFVLYQAFSDTQTHFRVGISVGKKIGNAVTRNRVKRQIRQAFFELREDIPVNCRLIIIARPSITDLTTAEIKRNLIHVLRLAKIL